MDGETSQVINEQADRMLHKITTEYIATEDRLRLSGESEAGVCIFWITQRMLHLLLPHILRWVETSVSERVSPVAQGSSDQESARRSMKPQQNVDASAASVECLVHSVDINFTDEILTLGFKREEGGDRLGLLSLNVTDTRQWLGIVYQQSRTAEWHLLPWPRWVTDAESSISSTPSVMH